MRTPPKRITVTKQRAATGQLNTALAIWFEYGDPVSIHTLAAAAQGVLQGVAGKKHPHPQMRDWLKKHPQRVQNIMRDPQNFFKHGWSDPKAVRSYQPKIGDYILADAALLHQDLYGFTPFIRAFTMRLPFEWEDFARPEELTKQVTQGIRFDDLGQFDRPTFLRGVLNRLDAVKCRESD